MAELNISDVSRILNVNSLQASNLLLINQYRNSGNFVNSITDHNNVLLQNSLTNANAAAVSSLNSMALRARAAARGINVRSDSFSRQQERTENDLMQIFVQNNNIINRTRASADIQRIQAEERIASQTNSVRGRIASAAVSNFLFGMTL